MSLSKKEKAIALLNSMQTSATEPANYVNPNKYNIQHNPVIADGVDGLQAALQHMAEKGIHMVYEKVHYVYGEGNYALVMSEGNLSGEPYAYYDLWKGVR